MQEPRNFNDPRYKYWRSRVYKRDGYACKLCLSKDAIEAHHIKRWADFPEHRFDINNGITLCKVCHNMIKDEEQIYEAKFSLLIRRKNADRQSKKQKNKDLLAISFALRKKI